jgi:uncharacterized peroxidase-related enzyme
VTYFSSLKPDAGARDALFLNPEAGRAMIDYHTAVLRQLSGLSVGEREFIAAYVSALNACSYCAGVHGRTAAAFGISEQVLQRAVDDLERAGIEPKMLAILRYVRKVTLQPARIIPADVEAVLAAGWTERDLHDAISVAALYNFMNRIVSGHGIDAAPAVLAERGDALYRQGYAPLRETSTKP